MTNFRCNRCNGLMMPFRPDGGCRTCEKVPQTVSLPWRYNSPWWWSSPKWDLERGAA